MGFYAASAIADGIRCEQVATVTERLICSIPALFELDRQLATHYASALSVSSDSAALKKTQRAWLRTQRDPCNTENCLEKAYAARLQTLAALIDEQNKGDIHPVSFRAMDNSEDAKKLSAALVKRGAESADRFLKLDDRRFLYINDSASRISAGLYLLDITSSEATRLVAGDAKTLWLRRIDNGATYFLVESGGGRGGKGALKITFLTIPVQGQTSNKVLANFDYDMESGMCGRGAEIGITNAGELTSFDVKENLLDIAVTLRAKEEDCKRRYTKNTVHKFSFKKPM